MNVIYSSSDLYSELAAVSIVSLFENSKDADQITVYVIDKGISEKHRADLQSLASAYGRELVLLENIDVEKIAEIKMSVGRWHISTFSRLFLLHVIPETVDKVIYIDCDMIIRHSLVPLWEMDMEGTWCMSSDDCRGENYRVNIGIPRHSIYTNNGLMVIDLDAWRKNNVEKMFIEFIKKYNGDITYVDQGVVNGVFQPLNKVKLLPIRYNAQTACYDLGYKGITACRNPIWAYTEEEFDADIADPVIVHFTTCFLSGTRPWYEKDSHKYRNEYLKYRGMSPWKDDPLWRDETPFMKKCMTKVSRLMPRKLMFFCIRVVHSQLYPMVRNMKNRVKSR